MAAVPLKSGRIEGVDVARAIAALVMIEGHAFDAFTGPSHRATFAYDVIFAVQTFPLPAFLVLAGAAVTLRIDAAIRRGEPADEVRRSIVKRGLTIVLAGYAVSLAYALIDGIEGIETVLRSDVLHVIGLSIAALGALGVGGQGVPDRRRLAIAALGLAVVPTALCPWLSPLGAHVSGPVRFFVALFVDVPRVTFMPFVPLVAWVAMGALVALAMLRTKSTSRAGAPVPFLIALLVGSAIVAALAYVATLGVLAATDGTLSRAHPAVWLNVIDLGARGTVVLAIGALASLALSDRVRPLFVRLGRGSLVAYVVHLPLCYGRLAKPLERSLDLWTAGALGLAIMGIAFLAVLARDALRAQLGRLVARRA